MVSFHITVGCDLLSDLRTFFNISWKVDVLSDEFPQFLLIWGCLYLFSFLKDYFAEYENLDWHFFPFIILNMSSHCLLFSIVFKWKTICYSSGGSFVCDKLFFSCAFKIFSCSLSFFLFICLVVLPNYFNKIHFPHSMYPLMLFLIGTALGMCTVTLTSVFIKR